MFFVRQPIKWTDFLPYIRICHILMVAVFRRITFPMYLTHKVGACCVFSQDKSQYLRAQPQHPQEFLKLSFLYSFNLLPTTNHEECFGAIIYYVFWNKATNRAIITKAIADIILIVLGLLFNQTETLSAVIPYIIRVMKSNKI